jgi:O-antigen/teichoic acid export membrane protein
MRELSGNKRIVLNLTATLVATFTSACVGFFLAPFIVRTIGVEAQGFVQLATNFTSYVALITVALNSMAGRFITIAIEQGDAEKADRYYASVFYGNIVITVVLLIPVALCIVGLDRLLDIPFGLNADVKWLFGFVFINFFASTVFSIWNNTFYITNRPYLQSLGNVISTLISAASVFVLFSVLPPKMYYSSLAGMGALAFTVCWTGWYKKILLPSLKVKRSAVSLAALREIISSGVWRTVQSVGEMLLNGLDLLICNLLISPVMMGVLALSKTLPAILGRLNWQIASTFAPQLTINYAKGENKSLLPELRKACKINAILGTVPIAGLVVYGKEFFRLWVPSQDAVMLQWLSVLACAGLLFVSGIQPIGNVFATANKVKPQAVSVIISGVLNTAIVFICLNLTDIGVYVIAGTSTAILIIRNVTYTVPAAARYLGFPWHTFFFGFAYSLMGSVIVAVVGFLVKSMLNPESWLTLVISCAMTGVAGLALNAMLIFNKNERRWIWIRLKGLLNV